MSDTRPVLVVTQLDDPTADLVISELYQRGVPVMRFDAADFPHALMMSAEIGDGGLRGQVQTASRNADLSAIRSLYYRRPSGFSFPNLDAQDARFAVAQARYGLGGVLSSLPGCLYVNHPHVIADAEFKPAQLITAINIGFDVPPTLITNDHQKAREFATKHERVIYKPLHTTRYKMDQKAHTVWVTEVETHEINASVAGTAHMFQGLVQKTGDLRVIVVGEQIFCVRIDSPSLDWRYNYDQISYSVVDPPNGITSKLYAYLERFGLVFGCFDFAIDEESQPIFLECNPNGQWAWLEEPTGLSMATAFADLLEKGQ